MATQPPPVTCKSTVAMPLSTHVTSSPVREYLWRSYQKSPICSPEEEALSVLSVTVDYLANP